MYTILIARFLGVLLLTAAALKAYGAAVEPIARSGIFASPAFQFLVVGIEVLLGVWLLSGWQPIGSWLLAIAAFTTFSAITFHQGWIGQASCGCAGRLVTINPWIAFAVDVVIVAALLRFRPHLQPFWDHRGQVLRIGAMVSGAYLVVLGCVAGYAHYRYGSIDNALATMRNERISLTPATLDMGEGSHGESREANLEIANHTVQPIRVIGGTADGSCTVLGDLPLSIPPGECRSIKVHIRLPNFTGRFTRLAELNVEDDGLSRVAFRLTGRINKPIESAQRLP